LPDEKKLGKFWRALKWKTFAYFIAVWNTLNTILLTFGKFSGRLVYLFPVVGTFIVTRKNLATPTPMTFSRQLQKQSCFFSEQKSGDV
jgi:hypothetical protein